VTRFLVCLSTLFGIGRSKIAPGTLASLVTLFLVYFLPPYWQAPVYVQIIVIAIVTLIGLPAAGAAAKYFEAIDPKQCVIDEMAGQMIALIMVPHKISLYLIAFALFRVFDIFKPFPIKQLEKPPHGIGVMLDDIGAGLIALGLIHLGLTLF
jgi:phosphatidylglycerophosphatase A